MASANLTAQNQALAVVIPATRGDKGVSITVKDTSAVGASVRPEVRNAESGEWHTLGVEDIADGTIVTAVGKGEGGQRRLYAWAEVRAIRTDANGGNCYATVEVR